MKKLNRKTVLLESLFPEKILQFGAGYFLRTFVNRIIDLLNEANLFQGSAVIINPTEEEDYAKLRRQDGLYHIFQSNLEYGSAFSKNRLISCINRLVNPYKEWEEYLVLAENPLMRFVISDTTENGIIFQESDLFGDAPPKSFPAKLTAWLYHRYQCFLGDETKGCIFLPCESMSQNGESLCQCIIQYSEAWNLGWDFQKWITHYNFFCNTVAYWKQTPIPKFQIEAIQDKIGYKDEVFVFRNLGLRWFIKAPGSIKAEIPFSYVDTSVKMVDDLMPFWKKITFHQKE